MYTCPYVHACIRQVRTKILDALIAGIPDKQIISVTGRLQKFATSTAHSNPGSVCRLMEGQLSKLPDVAEWVVPLIRYGWIPSASLPGDFSRV